ncbi:MAG: MBL fold metallo-hydrolase [Candidatus Marsarchaeota archaeon]|nr:MBL fold metallo-hydrolase [Candidatus Marsarchaeota archaeon]
MPSLTFYGGLNEIGGNKILLEQQKSRIFLDFGQSFSLLDDYFVPEGFLSPRERFGLKDYFEFGLQPKLPGLYNKEALAATDLAYASESSFDAVLITHAHNDHVAHLKYLHPGIPVYMGEATKKILESTAETTRQSFWREESDIRTFRTGQKLSIGEFEVVPVHVDHSVPGAYGFIIETKEGSIAYSGDLRAHGHRPDLTEDFVKKAIASEPKALIIEGTRVALNEMRKNHTETTVQNDSQKVAHDTKGLVMAMRYPKDLDRFRTFYSVAKETGRTIVISLKTAHLLQTLRSDAALGLPDPFSDKHIKVYERKLSKYPAWQKPLLEKCVDASFVHEHQKDLIFELDFYYFGELVDVQPAGGACIHSMSEPFEEDPMSQVGDEVLRNWLEHYKLAHHQLHASGHASRQEIMQMIGRVNPKQVFPVHTHAPELFKESGKPTALLKKNEKCEI